MKPSLILVGLLVAVSSVHGCRKPAAKTSAQSQVASYDSETDWTDSQRVIPLGYQQAQGKRVFYQYCVWCHAESSPAGPSNRSNLTPVPALTNDGSVLNGQSDEYLQNIITLGGSALGKSGMMPPYGKTLTPDDIKAVIAFTRAIAQPIYEPSARPGSQYSPR
jgi:mono/diheme cytochrome c family protein